MSEDEYSGHVFALGLVARFVDDADIRSTAVRLLSDVGTHLVANQLQIRDWDGRVTKHGRLFAPPAGGAYAAAMSLAFMATAARATGRADLTAFLEDCLLQRSGAMRCLPWWTERRPRPYDDYLSDVLVFFGEHGCQTNYNNLAMFTLSLQGTIWNAPDLSTRQSAQRALDTGLMRAVGQERPGLSQHNAWFDFVWAAHKRLEPGSDGPAFEAVRDGVCQLREMLPTFVSQLLVEEPERAESCRDRFGGPSADIARTASQRCAAEFYWWHDPYEIQACDVVPRKVFPPQAYLLPYWMGRYYGFVGEGL